MGVQLNVSHYGVLTTRCRGESFYQKSNKNKDANNLYSPNTIRIIKSGRMKWAGYVACTGGNYCMQEG
jgi:hypothetical protein